MKALKGAHDQPKAAVVRERAWDPDDPKQLVTERTWEGDEPVQERVFEVCEYGQAGFPLTLFH